MRLAQAHVRDYRSVNDSGAFDVEHDKTILVGINEAGKTAILKALEQLNAPRTRPGLRALTDYPRSRYTEVQRGERAASEVVVVEATFTLDEDDRAAVAAVAPELGGLTGVRFWRNLDNTRGQVLLGAPDYPTFDDIEEDLLRLKATLSKVEGIEGVVAQLDALMGQFSRGERLVGTKVGPLETWLVLALPEIDEDNERDLTRLRKVRAAVALGSQRGKAVEVLSSRLPLFVYYSTYFQVHPRIDLRSLAAREAQGDTEEGYDFGNLCLLKVVGLTARELSELADGEPTQGQYNNRAAYDAALQAYQDNLDDRANRLNAASVALTQQIRAVWGDEQVTLRFNADGHYLKVVVVDDLGVEVELDLRSEGFRWLVSFFIVFQAQSQGDLKGAVLLLDEPGMSLHALKQQQFRYTVGELAGTNQVLYTTHSPFMVGSDELDLVRIVEMTDRATGTKVHTRVSVDDPRSLYPLQAALGYELAQSMFTHTRNLVCEGYTDLLYVEALNVAASDDDSGFKHPVALVPASSASKVIYYVTVLSSQKFKVAALLDSDQAGNQAAEQDELVAMLERKRLLRTKDFTAGEVTAPEIEDLLRETLVKIAAEKLGWDIAETAAEQPARRVVDIFTNDVTGFSKFKLAQAFLSWLGEHGFDGLTPTEQTAVKAFFTAANKALA